MRVWRPFGRYTLLEVMFGYRGCNTAWGYRVYFYGIAYEAVFFGVTYCPKDN